MPPIERVSLELTNRCGKACWFCYNGSAPAKETTWTVDDVVSFVRDCAAQGVRAVSFGGGEPLEFEGLFAIFGALRGLLFRSCTTNGLLLDDHFDALVRAAPDKVHVSVHFPDREAEVARVIRQVHALEDAGIRGGVNLLVAASKESAALSAASRLRAAGIGNDRIVYLPMRGQDTPSPEAVARVAGGAKFQSTTCLSTCVASPRFVSLGWDRRVAWCSYTTARRTLEAPTHAALLQAIDGLGLTFCGGLPETPSLLPIVRKTP